MSKRNSQRVLFCRDTMAGVFEMLNAATGTLNERLAKAAGELAKLTSEDFPPALRERFEEVQLIIASELAATMPAERAQRTEAQIKGLATRFELRAAVDDLGEFEAQHGVRDLNDPSIPL